MPKTKKIFFTIIYWLSQLTWGFLLTFIGALVTLFCLIFLKGKLHKNGFGVITEVGGNWGGISMGPFAFCGNYYGGDYWEVISAHEFGHSLWHQHWIMGPLFIFLVAIPSVIRYWYERKHDVQKDWYIKFWAEDDATKIGIKWKKLLGQLDKDAKIEDCGKIYS